MASRSFVLAAVALFALVAVASAADMPTPPSPRPSPKPITDPCSANFTALSAALTNATNTQLAKSYGQTNTTSKDRSTKFTVPRICGPFGTCVGGNTYSASVGKTRTTTGEHDITSAWTLKEDSCHNDSAGVWTVSGTLDVQFTWTSPIIAATQFFVTGFLGTEFDFTVEATINDMSAKATGTWTVVSSNGVTGNVTALSFGTCTVSTSSVDLEANGASLSSAASKVEEKIDGAGPQLCTSLNTKMAPKIIGKSFPL